MAPRQTSTVGPVVVPQRYVGIDNYDAVTLYEDEGELKDAVLELINDNELDSVEFFCLGEKVTVEATVTIKRVTV